MSRRPKRRSRAELETERNVAALEAMFFWGLGQREGSERWARKGDAAASVAMAMHRELTGAPSDVTPCEGCGGSGVTKNAGGSSEPGGER